MMGYPYGSVLGTTGTYSDVSGSVSFGSSRTPDSDISTFVVATVEVSASGTTEGLVSLNIGATQRGLNRINAGLSANQTFGFSFFAPAGTSYTISNDTDPNSGNTIRQVHELPLGHATTQNNWFRTGGSWSSPSLSLGGSRTPSSDAMTLVVLSPNVHPDSVNNNDGVIAIDVDGTERARKFAQTGGGDRVHPFTLLIPPGKSYSTRDVSGESDNSLAEVHEFVFGG